MQANDINEDNFSVYTLFLSKINIHFSHCFIKRNSKCSHLQRNRHYTTSFDSVAKKKNIPSKPSNREKEVMLNSSFKVSNLTFPNP